MNESTRRHGSLGFGERLNAIHAHRQRDLLKWPWLLILALAVLLAAWALRRRPSHEARSYEPSTHETTNPTR
jgi:MYXO-CTERM domain-containing protein